MISLKGSVLEFLENRRAWENQSPEKIARRVDFSEPLALYNANSLQAVDRNAEQKSIPHLTEVGKSAGCTQRGLSLRKGVILGEAPEQFKSRYV